MPCGLVNRYQYFGRTHCLNFHLFYSEDGDSEFLRKVGTYLPNCSGHIPEDLNLTSFLVESSLERTRSKWRNAIYYCCFKNYKRRIRDSSLGIATTLLARRPRFDSRERKEIILSSIVSRLALWPTQPPIQLVRGSLSQRVKLSGREADYWTPSNAEAKNGGTYLYSLYLFTA
jgi:hypothetical protein